MKYKPNLPNSLSLSLSLSFPLVSISPLLSPMHTFSLLLISLPSLHSLSSPEPKPTMLISGSSPLKSFLFLSPSLMVRLMCHSTQGRPAHTQLEEKELSSPLSFRNMAHQRIQTPAQTNAYLYAANISAKIVKLTTPPPLETTCLCGVVCVSNEIPLGHPKHGSIFCTKYDKEPVFPQNLRLLDQLIQH